jgi:molybdopterin-guanine dinucleotide biosynthesis protein A
MALSPTDITGLILAGGQGSRMGGSDKGLVLFNDKPMIVHAIERLAPQVGSLIINANRNADIYSGFDFPVVADVTNPQNEEFAGPLAGLLAGLRACTTDWLLTVPCDSPNFPLDLTARFIAATEQAGCSDLLVAKTPVQTHPVFMLVHKELTHQLAAFLASGERKMGFWQKQNGATFVEFPDEAAFANLNTPDELNSLESSK